MAKERVFNEVFGKRCTIKGNKGFIAARRTLVEDARQHVLSGARGTLQKHAHIGPGHALRKLKQAHAGRIHEDIGGASLRRPHAFRCIAPAGLGKIVRCQRVGRALIQHPDGCSNISRGDAHD